LSAFALANAADAGSSARAVDLSEVVGSASRGEILGAVGVVAVAFALATKVRVVAFANAAFVRSEVRAVFGIQLVSLERKQIIVTIFQ
jgi:hypothetical protein